MNLATRSIELAAPVAVPEQEIPSSGRKWPISYGSVGIVTIFADAVIILLASILAGIAYHAWVTGAPGDVVQYTGVAAVVAALFISLMRGRGMYRLNELLTLRRQIRTACLLWAAAFLLLAAAVFAPKIGHDLSRGTNLLFAAIGLCALVAHRIWWRSLLTRGMDGQQFSGRKIVLITDQWSQDESKSAEVADEPGSRLEHHFKLPPPQRGSRARAETIAQAIAKVRGSEVEQIVVGTDLSHWPELRDLIAQLRILPLPVNVVPVGAISEVFRQPSREVGNAVRIEVQRGPPARSNSRQREPWTSSWPEPGWSSVTPASASSDRHQARFARTGVLSAAALRIQWPHVSNHEIPHHASRRRMGRRSVRRSATTAG